MSSCYDLASFRNSLLTLFGQKHRLSVSINEIVNNSVFLIPMQTELELDRTFIKFFIRLYIIFRTLSIHRTFTQDVTWFTNFHPGEENIEDSVVIPTVESEC